MREGVIADDVSCLRYNARDIGALLHVTADHEECRPHAVLGQHFEQFQRVRIVGPVIISQGDLPAAAHSGSESPSVPLRG